MHSHLTSLKRPCKLCLRAAPTPRSVVFVPRPRLTDFSAGALVWVMARGGETNCNGKIFSGGFSGVGGGGCRDDSGGEDWSWYLITPPSPASVMERWQEGMKKG